MALDDLDLEFEDEEEVAKKKKSDVLHQDVDIEFHTHDHDAKWRPPGRPVDPRSSVPQAPAGVGQVRKIDEARSSQPTAARRPNPVQRQDMTTSGPRAQGSSALKSQAVSEGFYEYEGQEIQELKEKVRKTEFNADVRVQVAEFKTEIMSELLGDMKFMDHQINQLLLRIHSKHPEMKQEVLMIKKILADFTTKKRK